MIINNNKQDFVNDIEESSVFKFALISNSCHGKSAILNLTVELLILIKILKHK
jgi:hypothetical protein